MMNRLRLTRWPYCCEPPVAPLLLAATFLCAAAGATSAAERGTAEERRACVPDVLVHCSEFIPDAELIMTCLREKLRDLGTDCRVVVAGPGKSQDLDVADRR
jgi:hypothetical protein